MLKNMLRFRRHTRRSHIRRIIQTEDYTAILTATRAIFINAEEIMGDDEDSTKEAKKHDQRPA